MQNGGIADSGTGWHDMACAWATNFGSRSRNWLKALSSSLHSAPTGFRVSIIPVSSKYTSQKIIKLRRTNEFFWPTKLSMPFFPITCSCSMYTCSVWGIFVWKLWWIPFSEFNCSPSGAAPTARLYAHIGERHDIGDLTAVACHHNISPSVWDILSEKITRIVGVSLCLYKHWNG